MTERQTLLESIASTAADYRAGELATLTPAHVDRWTKQFDKEVQLPLVRELNHVLPHTYFSRTRVQAFLAGLVINENLAGKNVCDFWKQTNFLHIQQYGHSQAELLAVFDSVLKAECGIMTAQCSSVNGAYIYLDDVMYSGKRIGNDLDAWIRGPAPASATVNVIVIAIHTLAEYLVKKRLRVTIAESGKNITIRYWRAANIENRKSQKKDSGVLWPAQLPEDARLSAYLGLPHRFPFEPRPPGGRLGPFSSEEGRQLLERELLLAGVKIRASCENPKDIMRPLGFSAFGLGFGSMIVTFRNCPNNSPLALWWGDPAAGPNHPFNKWYPLFPRKTYGAEIAFDVVDF
ncbi:MAG: phosphoribosyltransferase-like protein [Gammaproteobacteria bacterium]